jgi:uncharacterized protein (TIGR00162 family)
LNDFDVVLDEMPKMDKPVLIQGLPGVGNVGRIAAKHMISTLQGRKFGDLYSTSFPHQVKALPDGTARLMRNELHYSRAQRDIIYLTGEMQPLPTDFRSHYAMAEAILELCPRLGADLIVTLGGHASGSDGDEPRRVFGIASTPEMASLCAEHGVEMLKDGGDMPIVGAAGLVPAMAGMRGMKAICLLGQTTADMGPDADAACALLERLMSILGIDLDLERVAEAASSIQREMDDILRKIERLERRGRPVDPGSGREGYIH